jgi:tetratricopeptide (TPR) repeat protein
LISGLSVGESLRLSKLKLIQEYGLSSLHWVNYLLYGDPDFVFFKISKTKGSKRKTAMFYRTIILKFGLTLVFIFLGIFLFLGLPKINPTKLYLYLHTVSEYRQGNNQTAVILGQRVIGKDQDFLAVYPVIAGAYQNLGNKEEALKYYFEYMLKSERLNNRSHLIQAYTKLGWFYQLNGQYVKALELYEKAINLSRQSKDKQNEALALRKLAVWNIEKNNYGQALDLLTKSAAINSEYPNNSENLKNLAADYFDIGLVYVNKDDYAAAKYFYSKSLKIFERLKLSNELSDCYFNLGEVYFYQKEYQKALEYYFKGLKVDQQQNNKANLSSGYNMIGELYLEINDLAKAENYFKQALELSEKINSQSDLANASYNLGLLYKKQGRKNMCREYWRKAQEIYRSVDPDKYQEIRKELLELDVI